MKMADCKCWSSPAVCLNDCRAGLVPCFVEFMSLQHPNNNVHNLRVVRLLVVGGALSPAQLLETAAMDVVRFSLLL